MASTIIVTAAAHIFAHYAGHTYMLPIYPRFGYSGRVITLSIWATGAAAMFLFIAMVSASMPAVKQESHNLFIKVHRGCSVVILICLYWHAPSFLMYATVPLLALLVDHIMRRAVEQPLTLMEVRFAPPVLHITACIPFRYKAGQYISLRCPTISAKEQHPFSVASAPESNRLCLAIRCHDGGWTERLRDIFATDSESLEEGFHVQFKGKDWLTGSPVHGATCVGSDEPLLLVSGPFNAPSMHFVEFGAVILACSGVGLTPAASCLTSLLRYRWRASSTAMPHSVYFCWIVRAMELPAFKWFAGVLSNLEVSQSTCGLMHGHAGESRRICELHAFVTGVPGKAENGRLPPDPQPAKMYSISTLVSGTPMRPYTGDQLIHWMARPQTSSKDMQSVFDRPRQHRENQAGCTFVWGGRPEWGDLFSRVADRHRGSIAKVGVMFCGSPAIGRDLKEQARRYSDASISFRVLDEGA
eukprot:NODE_5732_length_1740_cov_4.941104.p1 GENE.NODE_5732_length_1740_cov_4.941104~~NODE_5732_length_1740_cov_4.941104.p1  ORF type:complete len:471 (-),score=57.49 NODE_5732_length_1740_cov_4.941104:27-1439(-)